ncbi:MAG: hypothetical protein H7301_08780 [Cryobacterium sp.]|nr:hypothetical protein [Oligoflexia bacterium]
MGRKTWSSFGIFGLVPLISFAGITPVNQRGTDACFSLMRPKAPHLAYRPTLVTDALTTSSEVDRLVEKVENEISSRTGQQLRIRARNDQGEETTFTALKSDFDGAHARVAKTPSIATPPGGRILKQVQFGYLKSDGFRAVVPLQYLVLNSENQVLEYGAGSDNALSAFHQNLIGRALSKAELKRIEDLNGKLLSDLRADPAARAKLREFAKSRGWNLKTLEPMLERSGLAYFDAEHFNLHEWRKKNGYSIKEMRDAGWMKISFNSAGEPSFSVDRIDGIRIPYHTKNGRIPIWRTRNTGHRFPKLPKYLGWPTDRAIDREFSVAEKLYQSELLEGARGKTVVITEGEFKCLIATQETGVITVGIPGISQFDSDIASALIDSGASEFVVILDRDAKGKALLRTDGISDSERAAYQIAKSLETAALAQKQNHIKIRIGLLPPGPAGEKLGIDDLILKVGPKPFLDTIKSAESSSDYAKNLGLDENFMELARRRSISRKALGEIQALREKAPLTPAMSQTASTLRFLNKELDRTFLTYLDHEFSGARSLSQVDARYGSISSISEVPNGRKKTLTRGAENAPVKVGKSYVDVESFTGDLAFLDYATIEAKGERCFPVPCGTTPYTTADLREAFSSGNLSGSLASDFEQGLKLADENGFVPQSFQDYLTVLSAGHVSEIFPAEEYGYVFEGQLKDSGRAAHLPLFIAKKDSGRAVAFIRMHTEEASTSNSRKQFEEIYQWIRER